jgi:hypothetical protein
MRNDQAAVARGEKARSNIKKEVGKLDNDQGWKNEELKKAEKQAKAERAPGRGDGKSPL